MLMKYFNYFEDIELDESGWDEFEEFTDLEGDDEREYDEEDY